MIIFSLLYNIGISAYHFLISLSAWTGKEKARLWKNGRLHWAARMREAIPAGTPIIWVHAASLGEFEQGRPVLEALRKKHPAYKILLTFFSPSGYEVRKDYPGADFIFYLPLDTKANARTFLDIVQPSLVLFIKYEFWYHFLTALYIRKIPTLLVSGIFRPGQVFFKWYGGPFRRILQQLTHIFVQNEISLQLLADVGITNASISGDTRFDRVWALRNERTRNERWSPNLIREFSKEKRVVVAGSTWPEDEQLLAKWWTNAPADVALIIAPHEIHGTHVAQIEALFPQAIRYSTIFEMDTDRSFVDGPWHAFPPNMPQKELDGLVARGQVAHERFSALLSPARVLIIDNVGMLSLLYRYGKVAYVGGGFGKEGIHNILEPATYGKPVLYGPVFDKFPEASELIFAGGGFVVHDATELETRMGQLLADTPASTAAANASAAYVENRQGATGKVLDYIEAQQFLSL